jgi:aminodeoxyfutalosine deaminase
METLRIQSAAIIVHPTLVFRPGQMVVGGGRILAVTGNCAERPDILFPSSTLSSGLVNPHTHLEFSDLKVPIPAGPTFPDWIGRVVAHRRSIESQLTMSGFLEQRSKAIVSGIVESQRAGVAVLGDIVTQPWQLPTQTNTTPLAETPISRNEHPVEVLNDRFSDGVWRKHLSKTPTMVALAEILGLDATRLTASIDWATQISTVQDATDSRSGSSLVSKYGLSPHSPYSIDFARVVQRLSASDGLTQVTAMHVAESREELEWLQSGSGPFREAFERLGVPTTLSRPCVDQVIEWLGTRQRSLLIHGNYLTDEQIANIAQHPSMTVVYCPRTHRHFGHDTYPLSTLMKAGVPVVLGTDSRASNPDLNLWEEARLVHATHTDMSPQWLYGAVTQQAAKALGVEEDFGSLLPGRRAYIHFSPYDSSVNNAEIVEDLMCKKPSPDTPWPV